MKVTHYIQPRMSGKSSMASKIMDDEDHSILINCYGREFSWENFKRSCVGHRYKTVIIDEFLFAISKSGYNKNIFNDIGCENLILFSTPIRQYSLAAFMLLRNFPDVFSMLISENQKEYVNKRALEDLRVQCNELINAFLDPNMVDIRHSTKSFLPKDEIEGLKGDGRIRFEMDFEAKFLTL